jgi:hypothetical protein
MQIAVNLNNFQNTQSSITEYSILDDKLKIFLYFKILPKIDPFQKDFKFYF